MTCSLARLAANRSNASNSTGPRTEAGKARSRRNGLKHGMTGAGVVLLDDDLAESERRAVVMEAEMRPSTEVGRFLVRRVALLTVRVERCSRQEMTATALLAVHAEARFGEDRIAEVDRLLSDIAREPATTARLLRAMPEGIDRMIAELLDLRDELEYGDQTRWDWTYGMKLADLTGARFMDIPATPVHALTKAIGGDYKDLRPGQGEGLPDRERRGWARDRLAELIDGEVQQLLTHRETLDVEAIERDRAGAADRSGFDPSKEATLARKYEAAAERGFFRTLREFRESEEAAAAGASPPENSEALGSSCPDEPGPAPEPAEAAEETIEAPPTVLGSPFPAPDRPTGPSIVGDLNPPVMMTSQRLSGIGNG